MKYTIESIAGIDVIFAPMEDAYSVTIEIMCKAGSIYENKQNNGISHFLEHLFFKGGEKYPTPKSVAEAVDKFGGEFNAYTGDEFAGYYVKCAPEFTERAIDVLADMMNNAKFNPEELEREKGVVIQELKMYEDNPMAMVMEKWQTYYFGDNSYGRPIIGTKENINSFTQQMLFDHKAQLYTKDNLIIVVAGNIRDKEAIVKQLEKEFIHITPNKQGKKPIFTQTLPQEHIGFFEQKNEQAHLIISAPGYDGNDNNKYAANILGTILGGNMSSRLFQNIREKQGLCYYIRGSHVSQEDSGTFLIRAGIDKERFDFGVEKIFEEIQNIAEGNITQEEFDNAIGYNEGQIQMGIESSDEMASFIGNQYLIYKKVESLPEILKKYK
ncbi:MAG TPA: pitrilysin family protein, partial [Candidatus Absconditabacterales bacterium]|nr:pitrilysin family protein [Candidatus Absconditabacterales bacterium]